MFFVKFAVVLHILVCLWMSGEVSAACDTATSASERLSQAVLLKFYQTQTDQWISNDNSAKVSAQVSNEATSYCAANPAACGVESCCPTAFKDLNVGVESGYPQNDAKDVTLKIYLDLPTDLNTTGTLQCVVSLTTLQTIVGNVRQNIKGETGVWITYAGDVFYGIPPDSQLNAILIPIACVVLIGVILTAVILHFWTKRREEVEKRKKKIESRKKSKTSKVTPTYNVAGENLTEKKSAPEEKPKRKDQLYKDKLLKSASSPGAAKNASIHSEDSAIKMEAEPPKSCTNLAFERDSATYEREIEMKPTGHLPAMSKPETVDEEHRERKRKSKKSKKHRKQRDTDSYGGDTGDDV